MNRRNAYLVPLQPHHPFEPIMALVLDAVDSLHTRRAYRRAYRRALTDFLTWHREHGTLAFTKALLQRYRAYMRRTFAKLSRNGGAELDQIKASLGHASVQTTERYVGETQRFTDAPADRIGLRVKRE